MFTAPAAELTPPDTPASFSVPSTVLYTQSSEQNSEIESEQIPFSDRFAAPLPNRTLVISPAFTSVPRKRKAQEIASDSDGIDDNGKNENTAIDISDSEPENNAQRSGLGRLNEIDLNDKKVTECLIAPEQDTVNDSKSIVVGFPSCDFGEMLTTSIGNV